MTHMAVGLFKTSIEAEATVNDLKGAGFDPKDLRILAEPRYMHVTGVLSTPEIDFCAELVQDLKAMGATGPEAQAYVQGVRNGGVLVFATGSIELVEKSAEIMNRHQAANFEELTGSETILSCVAH
ncbi:MAG TPA: hypothetical protein VE178_05060, partial [Silvibacterium sp.]|nr:hypothetical protein [Silvibacterium sp.]